MQDIVHFATVMGPLSSLFDLLTFYVLYHWVGSSPPLFRTGWFVESIATQTLVIFLIRTTARPWRDRPNRVLLMTTLAALLVAVAIPYLPIGAWFGFQPLPLAMAGALGAIVALYLVCAELLKTFAARPRGVNVPGKAT
jgi:Mg2+-importing ATPase